MRIAPQLPSGRLLNLNFALTYDSGSAWFLEPQSSSGVNDNVAPMYSRSDSGSGALTWGGWSAAFPQLNRVDVEKPAQHQTQDGTSICGADTGYVFTDSSGGKHTLGLSHAFNQQAQACIGYSPYAERDTGGDDLYQAALIGPTSCALCAPEVDGDPKVVDASGTVFDFGNDWGCLATNGVNFGLPTSIEDSNGNLIRISGAGSCGGFTATDTLGRTALQVSNYGFSQIGHPSTTSTITVAGLSQPYTATWNTISPTGLTISTEQVVPDNECSAPPTTAAAVTPRATPYSGPVYVITSIGLPNGQQYNFSYDSVTGFLARLPIP